MTLIVEHDESQRYAVRQDPEHARRWPALIRLHGRMTDGNGRRVTETRRADQTSIARPLRGKRQGLRAEASRCAGGVGTASKAVPGPERSPTVERRNELHDRGFCPLYVRAQPETAGLTGTQRDYDSP